LGKEHQDIVDIATAIELIHTATLSMTISRRGGNSARQGIGLQKNFGLKSLVTGDFLH
jgi:hypothetical protein